MCYEYRDRSMQTYLWWPSFTLKHTVVKLLSLVYLLSKACGLLYWLQKNVCTHWGGMAPCPRPPWLRRCTLLVDESSVTASYYTMSSTSDSQSRLLGISIRVKVRCKVLRDYVQQMCTANVYRKRAFGTLPLGHDRHCKLESKQ